MPTVLCLVMVHVADVKGLTCCGDPDDPDPDPPRTAASLSSLNKNGCRLACGRWVEDGWKDLDEGPNSCNHCTCKKNTLCCTEMKCSSPSAACAAPCNSDRDCGSNTWCREAVLDGKCLSHKMCVMRNTVGGPCGEGLPCLSERCLSEYRCAREENESFGTCAVRR